MTIKLKNRLRKLEAKSARGDPALFAHMLWRLRQTGSMAAAVEAEERETGRRLRLHPDFLLRVERFKNDTDLTLRLMREATDGTAWMRSNPTA